MPWVPAGPLAAPPAPAATPWPAVPWPEAGAGHPHARMPPGPGCPDLRAHGLGRHGHSSVHRLHVDIADHACVAPGAKRRGRFLDG
eukprot:15451323-Alexandrium_andersonii.AAC.1